MTHPSKRKGNGFERELVADAVSKGFAAERAYGSNGRALGHAEDVDLVVEGKRIQAKRRKSVAAFLRPSETVDAVVVREDRGEALVVVRWTEYLDLLAARIEPPGGVPG